MPHASTLPHPETRTNARKPFHGFGRFVAN
jgi:hypothetical protein